jgi:hypothetical protein
MSTSKSTFFQKNLQFKSNRSDLITKLRKLQILKIRITARISIFALKLFDLVDCVLKLRESKLSNSFCNISRIQMNVICEYWEKTPQKLRIFVFMHFNKFRTLFYGLVNFREKILVGHSPHYPAKTVIILLLPR